MCFLPLGCLKFIVGLGAFSTIVISLGLLVLTIYANVQKKQIITNTGGQLVTDALVGLYLGAAVFMVLGICGIYGAIKSRKKQKNSGNCLLFFYLIGVFVFFVLFIAGTIFFFVGPETIFGNDCTSGAKTTLVNELYQVSNQATTKFCTDDCQCYIQPANQNTYLVDWLKANGRNYTTTLQNRKFYQACLPNQTASNSNVVLMGALEQLLECGGWCSNQTTKYYKFSDINKCVTKQCIESRESCHDSFKNFLTGKGQIMGFACGIATLICLLNIITVCCICYHPSKQGKGSNFYARMMDQD